MLNEQLNIKNIKAKSHQLAIFSDKLEVDPLCIQTLPPVNALEKQMFSKFSKNSQKYIHGKTVFMKVGNFTRNELLYWYLTL